jgi:hypothetical protein
MILRIVFLAAFLVAAAATARTAPAPERKSQSIYERILKKSDLPGPGEEVADPKDAKVVYYLTNSQRMWGKKENVGKHPGLYTSKDRGQTWRLLCLNFEFQKLYIHPDTGRLFAIIGYDWLDTNEEDGTLEHCSSNKIITSTDGRRWKDISGKQGYITDLYGIFRDPDNAGRVCLEGCAIRAYVLQAKDEQYSEWNWLRADRPQGERLLKNKPAAEK